jgi:hypothetical protein
MSVIPDTQGNIVQNSQGIKQDPISKIASANRLAEWLKR